MTVSMLEFKEKDDGTEDVSYPRVEVEEITNGWVVTLEDSNDEEFKYVYDFKNLSELLKKLKEVLGAR